MIMKIIILIWKYINENNVCNINNIILMIMVMCNVCVCVW